MPRPSIDKYFFSFLFTLLAVKVMRRVFSSSTFSTKTSHIRRTWNNTFIGVFRGWRVFYALPHTECEITSSLVWFHVRLLFFTLPHTLNMKQHLRLWSVCFLCPTTHAKHEITPPLVWFLVFGSPVRSGLLTPRAIDHNRNRSFHFQILQKTGPNQCGPVHIGFLWLRNWLELVKVQSSY